MLLYKIHFLDTDKFYIGITSNLNNRRNSHKYFSIRGERTPLYSCMRKHPEWFMSEIESYDTREEAAEAEIFAIAVCRKAKRPLLNLADGGEGGFVVRDKAEWVKKLIKARVGRKPSLGMKHTEENRKIFSEVSIKYWSTQETYNPSEICKLSFKDAKEKFGISKTHYYRLKRAANNDCC